MVGRFPTTWQLCKTLEEELPKLEFGYIVIVRNFYV